MKPGDVGPLQTALRAHLDKVREAREASDVCKLPTPAEIAAEIGFPPANVYAAIARLRRRRSLLAAFIRDAREMNCRRVRYHAPTLGIVDAAQRAQTLLERAWRGSALGELE